MASVDFAEIKRNVSIVTVAQMLKLNLREGGGQLRGICPICGTDDPRAFVITPAKELFYCHSCKTGGDCIKLLAQVTHKDARSAAVELRDRYATIPPTAPSSKPERRLAGFDAEAYAKRLDPSHASLPPLGVSPETFTALKAGYSSSGILRGRLAMPLYRDGAVIGYVGVALGDEEPRLLFPNNLKAEKSG